jgi:acetyltransferase
VRIHCLNDVDVGPVVIVDLGSLPFTRPGDGHASRLAPLGSAAATALLHNSPVADALTTTGLDPEALIDTIVRVSHLVADHPQLAEVDINPVILSTQGCTVTDARVVVRATTGPVRPLRQLG